MKIIDKIDYNRYSKLYNVIRSKAESPNAGSLDKKPIGSLKENRKLAVAQKEILADDEIRAFYSILRDAVINSGYTFIGEESEVKKAEEVFKKLKFRKRFKRLVYDALSTLHAYAEIERSKGKEPIALNIPNSSAIYPKMDIHGKIYGFRQDITTDTGGKDYIEWKPNEMCHFTIDESTADYFGVTYVETMKQIVDIKHDILDYISYLFKTNAFRVHYHGKNINIDELESYYDLIRSQYETNSGIIVTVGEEELIGRRYVTEDVLIPLIDMLNMLRNRILTLLRVPPIIAGTVDNSNRSNSDVQTDTALRNRIKAIQEDLEDDINFDLLPLLNIDGKKVEFKFREFSIEEMKSVTDIMIKIIQAGGIPQEVAQWTTKHGYDMPISSLPSREEVKEKEEKKIEEQKVKLDKNSDLHPSREKQDNFKEKDYGKKKD